jgi:hypothetical protein
MVASISTFQADPLHLDHLGKRLKVDNVLGQVTRWSIDFETLSLERRLVIRKGQQFIGLVEDPPGSNDDPEGIIDGWLRDAGAREGDPWCASAASAWLSVVKPVRIPGALNLIRHFPQVDSPWVGDVCGYPTNDKGNGHVFLVLGVDSVRREIMTLEGNCNNECQVVRRPWTAGLLFGRTFNETRGTRPGVISSVPLLIGGGTR